MNKRTAQAFALGILLSAIFLWAGNSVIADKDPKHQVTVANAKQLLETKGYKVLDNSEFTKLSEKKEVVKEEAKKDDSEEKPKEEVATEEVQKEEVKEVKKFTLVISGGMAPGDVAVMLKSQEIIDDAKKFERYLIDQGFHTKVQIGKYELTDSMDYYQIAKIITKNR